jgi:hypothetical protein
VFTNKLHSFAQTTIAELKDGSINKAITESYKVKKPSKYIIIENMDNNSKDNVKIMNYIINLPQHKLLNPTFIPRQIKSNNAELKWKLIGINLSRNSIKRSIATKLIAVA